MCVCVLFNDQQWKQGESWSLGRNDCSRVERTTITRSEDLGRPARTALHLLHSSAARQLYSQFLHVSLQFCPNLITYQGLVVIISKMISEDLCLWDQ